MKHLPALDGLRALAIAPVLAFHSFAPFAWGGFIGVDVFFVLSGFLITSLLSAELRATGRIELLGFYKRRALRLYPTLLLMLATFLVAAPHVWPHLPSWSYAAVSALYLTDYVRAFGGVREVLSFTWSLAVEEHFYLLWPLVLPFVLKRANPVRALLVAFAAATLWRLLNYAVFGWEPTYFRFDTRLSGILLGSAIAMAPTLRLPRYASSTALAILALLATAPAFHEPLGMTVFMTAAEMCTSVVLLAVAQQRRNWLLEQPVFGYIGRLSYGIYIWHFPLVYWLRDRYEWQITLAVGSGAAVLLAAATFHLIDLPLRRYRYKAVTTNQVEQIAR
jgi:peptidoglycan/LPS O-acetylase OafA/YrhL